MISNFLPKIPKIPTPTELTKSIAKIGVGEFNKSGIDIDLYRTKFLGNNARSYLFFCEVGFPEGHGIVESPNNQPTMASNITTAIKNGIGTAIGNTLNSKLANLRSGSDFRYFVKSTSLPESIFDETVTHFCGAQYKIPSVRRTQDWVVTFLVDNNASVVRSFYNWHNKMYDFTSGNYGNAEQLMANQKISLLGMDGTSICDYELVGAWPKMIGNVTLDYSANEFATIDITFSYQYHKVTPTQSGSGVESMIKELLGYGASAILSKL
jgi:hypothetical protein